MTDDSKPCTKCGETKPLGEFHRDAGRPDGRVSMCKECRTPRRTSGARVDVKSCGICGEVKSATDFYLKSASRDGLFPNCMECERTRRADYRRSHPDRIADQRSTYYEANSDEIAKRGARRYAESRSQILAQKAEYRAARRDVLAEYAAQHRIDHPHVAWVNTYRGRCRRFGFEPVVEEFTKGDVIERYGDSCFYCGGEFEQLDHDVPVSREGSHTLANVRPACAKCNFAKFNKTSSEWLAERRSFDRLMDRIQGGGPLPSEQREPDYEPDGYTQAELDRLADEAADAYERERGY